MSKGNRNRRERKGGDEPDAIWVQTDFVVNDITMDGAYEAVIHFGPDNTMPLTPTSVAADYIAEIMSAMGAAAHDAAILRQLTEKFKMTNQDCAAIITFMREARGKNVWKFGPLEITPIVSASTRRPLIQCRVGKLAWQWERKDILRHCGQVLEITSTQDYDTAYRRILINEMGLEEPVANHAVNDLQNFQVR